MQVPGYAVDSGKDKADRPQPYYVRYVDARGGTLRTWTEDGKGVPHDVVRTCLEAAADYPHEFAP